jgi:hypothetical protein
MVNVERRRADAPIHFSEKNKLSLKDNFLWTFLFDLDLCSIDLFFPSLVPYYLHGIFWPDEKLTEILALFALIYPRDFSFTSSVYLLISSTKEYGRNHSRFASWVRFLPQQ